MSCMKVHITENASVIIFFFQSREFKFLSSTIQSFIKKINQDTSKQTASRATHIVME